MRNATPIFLMAIFLIGLEVVLALALATASAQPDTSGGCFVTDDLGCFLQGKTCCAGGVCVDTDSDDSNCGSCGSRCSPGETCCGGVCADTTSDDSNCGGCGRRCSPGETCCGGVCVDTKSDGSNCGSCGKDCSALSDRDRRLEKREGPLAPKCCNGFCFFTSINRFNCGRCSNECPDKWSCSAGTCTAPAS